MYTCRNCGAQLRFDIKTQKMCCDHCKSLFDPKLLTEPPVARTAVSESPEDVLPEHGEQHSSYGYYKAVIYKCPQCGGELISTEESAVDYCTYCGSFVELERHAGRGVRPQYIVPFAKTKEECIESYKQAARRAIFAPDSMRTPAFLERFRGMYMPYWLYDVKIGENAKITSTGAEKTKGEYAVTTTKVVPVAADSTYDNIAFDASGAFSDRISRQLTPFATENIEDFSPAYMAGFYAVNADVTADTYEEDAETVAARVAMKSAVDAYHESEAKKGKKILSTKFDKLADDELRRTMDAKVVAKKPALLPVWFLTWRQRKRVGYSVVNGISGECVSMFPISVLKFVAFALILALPLYLIADPLLTMTPKMALLSGAIMSLIMLYIYKWQLLRIMEHEHHDDDIGYFSGEEGKKRKMERGMKKRRDALRKKEKRENRKSIKSVLLIFGFIALQCWEFPVLLLINFGEKLFSGYTDNGGFRLFAYIVICIILLFASVKLFRTCKEIDEGLLLAAGILPAIAIVISLYIELRSPVQDMYYYLGVFLNLFVILVLELILIGRYNTFVTEQVPNFFAAGSTPALEKAPNMAVSEKSGGVVRNQLLYGLTVIAAVCMLVLAVIKTSDVDWRVFISETSHTIQTLTGAGAGDADIENGTGEPDMSTGLASAVSLNGNQLIIDDQRDLLSSDEELRLRQAMAPILEYGNAAFVSEYPDTTDTGLAAARAYDRMFEEEDGTEFYFDMRNRKIFIYSMGAVLKSISKGYANTITDNVYRYASYGQYELCAEKAFEQIYTVLDGGKIAQPMKHLSNAFLAVILGLLASYSIVIRTVAGHGKAGIEMIGGAGGLGAAIVVAQHGKSSYSTKKRRIQSGGGGHYGGSHGGWSGGGGGFSGGGGHSGGFSGGGGGHSF